MSIIRRFSSGGGTSGSAPVVILTQATYDALSTPDPGTLYVISEDAPGGGGGGGTGLRAYEAAPTMPTAAATDDSAYSMGLEFYVTAAATLTEIRFWQPTTNSPSSATRSGALYQVSNSTNVSGTQSFPTTVTGWNTLTLASPFALTANVHYKATVLHPAGRYPVITSYYATGSGSTDFTNGILVVPSTGNGGQNTFTAGGTMAYPASNSSNSFYGIDVTVVPS